MEQLVDLQFTGYRDIFEDINKAICGRNITIKNVAIEFAPYGGLTGRICSLETRIQRLEERVDDIYREIKDINYQMMVEREQKKMFEKESLPADIESILPVIRHEAQDIAEAVFRTQIRNCCLKIN